MTNKRNDRKATRRAEAEARNAVSDAAPNLCGHVHGAGVGCDGRINASEAVLREIFETAVAQR